MEIFGFGITLLSLVIAYQAWQNGKWMKKGINQLAEGISQLGGGITKLGELIVEEGRATRELIKSMDERTAKTLEKMDEHLKIIPGRTVELLRETKQEYKPK